MTPRTQPSNEAEQSSSSTNHNNNDKSTDRMRRSDSENSFVSVPEDGPVKDYRDYRVRKSGLIA